jgi:hypothetical protein
VDVGSVAAPLVVENTRSMKDLAIWAQRMPPKVSKCVGHGGGRSVGGIYHGYVHT